jgi:hypothetical protein
VLGDLGLLPLPKAFDDVLPMNTAGVCLALGLGTAMLILGAGWLRRRPGRRRRRRRPGSGTAPAPP